MSAKKSKSVPLSSAVARKKTPATEGSLDTLVIKDKTTGKPLEDSNIEKELLLLGYMPTEKVFVKCNDGSEECPYIKAFNRNMHPVYIEIDVAGFVPMEEGDPLTESSNDVNIVPYSIKMSELECASLDTCGIALECKKGVCILKRNDKMHPTEKNYIVKTNDGELKDRSSIMENNVISYPIIKLSEIRYSPEQAIQTANDMTARIRKRAYKNTMNDFSKITDEINLLNANIKALAAMRDQYEEKLQQTIEYLEGLNDTFYKDDAGILKNEENTRKKEQIQRNLVIRYQKFWTLLQTLNILNSKKEEIHEFLQI